MVLSRHEMLMQMAEVVAQRGTCDRLQVGCVVNRDGRIIATGYNGAPAGLPHCDHAHEPPIRWVLGDDTKMPIFESIPGKIMAIPNEPMIVSSGCQNAVHAEANTIAFAARHGVALEGSEMYVTHMPCLNCAKLIVNAGVERVIYKEPYRLTEGVELLKHAGIRVFAFVDLE